MRSYYTRYFKGLEGIKAYRSRLVTAPTIAAVDGILEEVSCTFAH